MQLSDDVIGQRNNLRLETVRKVAVLRALYLGDLLVAIPALRALRRSLPDAEVTLISLPWARPFIKRYGYVDRFLEFPGYKGIPEVPLDEPRTRRFLRRTSSYSYDVAVQMHGSGVVSNCFVAELGAAVSAGCYQPEHGLGPLDAGIEFREDEHEIRRCIRLLESIGVQPDGEYMEFPLLNWDLAGLKGVSRIAGLKWEKPVISIAPSAKASSRRWPAEYFSELGDKLAEEYDAGIVLLAGPNDKPVTDAIVSRMKTQPVNLTGMTSTGVLGAVIANSALFIGNDSGPAHLACAVDTPSVALFGPGKVSRWGPLDRERHRVVTANLSCLGCERAGCPRGVQCMRSIKPAMVFAEVEHLLGKVGLMCLER